MGLQSRGTTIKPRHAAWTRRDQPIVRMKLVRKRRPGTALDKMEGPFGGNLIAKFNKESSFANSFHTRLVKQDVAESASQEVGHEYEQEDGVEETMKTGTRPRVRSGKGKKSEEDQTQGAGDRAM